MKKDAVHTPRLAIRIDPIERDAWEVAAKSTGLTLSAWIRSNLTRIAHPPEADATRTTHPASLPPTPPVNPHLEASVAPRPNPPSRAGWQEPAGDTYPDAVRNLRARLTAERAAPMRIERELKRLKDQWDATH